VPWTVPYVAQFASPELAGDIVSGRLAAAEDPRWAEFGYPTRAAYGFWAPRLCGIACLAMAIPIAMPGRQGSLAALAGECVAEGGYLVWSPEGEWLDHGWVYAPMLTVARRYGLAGEISTTLEVEDLCRATLRPAMVIASVNPHHVRGERLDEQLAPGGHLVVVLGFEARHGECVEVLCHNPSGTRPETRAAARVDSATFRRAFAGRGILLWPTRP
jgi:hypothetical protein